MGGNAADTLEHLAGYGVGALSALTSIKGGGLQNYFLNRQRAIEDPAFRASLVGSPFTSGMFFQSGSDVPAAAPGTMPAAAAATQPADFVGPLAPAPAVAAPSDVAWLQQQTPTRRYLPNLPPLPAETQVQVQAAQGIVSGLQSADPVIRAQAKLAGKIPLTPQETGAVIQGGKELQAGLGPGGTVGVALPGMPITIGSPYSVSPVATDEYQTYGEAAAYANAHGGAAAGWTVTQTNRGTFKAVQAELPRTPPAPVPAGGAPGPQPAQAPAPAPAAPTAPAAVPAPSATMPPPPPSPPPAPPPRPGPSRHPAPSPRPAAQTGTPALTAGQVVIPAAPAPPSYAGGPWDLNAPAPGSVPAQQGYPSPAFDDQGAVGYPSAAFDDEGGPKIQAAKPLAASGGTVDLNAPFLRQLEAERGLPTGVLSAMAEKESGGNALKVNPDPRSTASGLFQITRNTAQAWGLSPEERFDPVKSATAVADTLAQRSRQVGIERAVGMHYGGPGTPYTQTVGISGLSPADYAGDVFRRVPKYTGGATPAPKMQLASVAAPTVAYPSPAFAETPVAPPRGGFFSWLGPSAAMAAEAPPGVAAPPPREAIPEYRPSGADTGIVAPPVPPTPRAPGAASAPVEPGTAGTAGAPLTGITTGPGGTTYTYDLGAASSELAADMRDAGIVDMRTASPQQIAKFNQLRIAREQRSQVSAEDTRRILRPASPGEAAGTGILFGYRSALDKFHEDFPDVAERDQYIGLVTRPMLDVTSAIRANPRFGLFVKDLSPFQGFDDVKKSLADSEVSDLSGTIPTGRETHPEYFEQNLHDFEQRLNESLGLRLALQQMPVGQQTAQWANNLRAQWARERADAKTADVMNAMGLGPPPPAAPPSGGESPPTITLAPPTTTATARPPTTTSLPPLVIFGHTPLY